MKKRTFTVLVILLSLLALPAWGEDADADKTPLKATVAASKDVELESGNLPALVGRYHMPYVASNGKYEQAPSAETLSKWWEAMGDPVLSGLIKEALEKNRDLAVARSRVKEARAQLGVTKSAILPWLDSTNSYGRTQTNNPYTGDQVGPIDYYSTGLDASWEIDLFGREKYKISASKASLQAQYGVLYNTWVSLSSEVAIDYISLRTLQERLRVAEKNMALQQDTLDLVQSQYNSGLTDELALRQAQYTLEQTRSTIPPIRTSIEQMLNILSILTGEVPGSLEKELGEHRSLPKPQHLNLMGIPAEALRQRPDIYAAERQLVAQVASTKAAKRALWPKLSLIGNIAFQTTSSPDGILSNDNKNFTIGPSLSLPIFHGNQIRSNIKVQTARQEQALATYEQTVLNAVSEVRNAFTAETQEKERNTTLNRGVKAARSAYEIAQDQYINGLTDFNNVISAQSALLNMEEQYTISKGEMISNIIRIYKAVGGGWGLISAENVEKTKGEGADNVAAEEETRETYLSDESKAYLEQIRKEVKAD
jgi:NodT family efflux transporter outer membrane factor (OMF) lipoprotein